MILAPFNDLLQKKGTYQEWMSTSKRGNTRKPYVIKVFQYSLLLYVMEKEKTDLFYKPVNLLL
jgi:hypothetical protein